MTGRWAAVLRVQITHLCAPQDWRSLAPANVQNGGYFSTARGLGGIQSVTKEAA